MGTDICISQNFHVISSYHSSLIFFFPTIYKCKNYSWLTGNTKAAIGLDLAVRTLGSRVQKFQLKFAYQILQNDRPLLATLSSVTAVTYYLTIIS